MRLVTALILLIIVGWFGGTLFVLYRAKAERRNDFLNLFKQSFTSGLVTLAGEPKIESMADQWPWFHRIVPVEFPDEFQITAPINSAGVMSWGVWCYSCSSKPLQRFVFCYSHARAPTRIGLKPIPKVYVDGTDLLVDGAPSTTGAAAKVVSLTSPATVNQPIQLVVNSPPGTRCEVEVFPKDVLTSPPVAQAPDAAGNVTWTWTCSPSRTGKSLMVEIKCLEPRGKSEMARVTKQVVSFVEPK